jgi:hypothetical protein
MRFRKRFGCVGCLTKCVLVFAVAGFAVLAFEWIVAPWAFRLGGTLRPVPLWQGVAHLHAASGDYGLSVWLSPSGGSRLGNFPTFTGGAYLCTPRGERIQLRLYGVMPERVSGDTNGKPMRIELRRRPWYGTIIGAYDGRPRLTLRGRWQNADLVMEDDGTLSMAFLPDGRVYDGPPARQPHATQTLPVVFHEVPWTTWAPTCQAGRP